MLVLLITHALAMSTALHQYIPFITNENLPMNTRYIYILDSSVWELMWQQQQQRQQQQQQQLVICTRVLCTTLPWVRLKTPETDLSPGRQVAVDADWATASTAAAAINSSRIYSQYILLYWFWQCISLRGGAWIPGYSSVRNWNFIYVPPNKPKTIEGSDGFYHIRPELRARLHVRI